jgi:hypothetical protein
MRKLPFLWKGSNAKTIHFQNGTHEDLRFGPNRKGDFSTVVFYGQPCKRWISMQHPERRRCPGTQDSCAFQGQMQIREKLRKPHFLN